MGVARTTRYLLCRWPTVTYAELPSPLAQRHTLARFSLSDVDVDAQPADHTTGHSPRH